MSKSSYNVDDTSNWIGNRYCIADELIESGVKRRIKPCGSSDAMAIYEKEPADGGEVYYDALCRSCNQMFFTEEVHGSSHAADLGIEGGVVTERKEFEKKDKKERITPEEIKEVLGYGYEGHSYRNLKDEYLKFFGHAVKCVNGSPSIIYYPETREIKGRSVLFGYKSRHVPKYFGGDNKGLTGSKSELSGQVKFRDWNFRDILIVGGEEDKVAAYQIWCENMKKKGHLGGVDNDGGYQPMPVVSPTTGEGSAANQIRRNFDFINKAERIFVALDNDEKGLEAMEDVCKVLPKEKVHVIHWSKKDPSNYIFNTDKKDYSKQFMSDFYAAKPLIATSILKSTELMQHISEVLLAPRVPLPDYMSRLSDMAGGGIRQFTINNIIGYTSSGKSTHINAMVYHWIFHSPEKPCIVSLEASAGQYALDLLSLHLEKNLIRIGDGQSVLDYLNTPEVKELWEALWTDEYGEPRFTLIDDRNSDIKSLEKILEESFIRDKSRIFVIDVLSDLLRGASSDLQEDHMMWQRNFVKKGATIFNVLHTSKPPTTKDGKQGRITEYQALGSGTFVQSAAMNILIERDKLTDDEIEKNTTRVSIPKLRGGNTGYAGEWFYDVQTRKVYDRNKYFLENPTLLPTGYDLKHNPLEDSSKDTKGQGKPQPQVNKEDAFAGLDMGNGVVL